MADDSDSEEGQSEFPTYATLRQKAMAGMNNRFDHLPSSVQTVLRAYRILLSSTTHGVSNNDDGNSANKDNEAILAQAAQIVGL